MAGEEAVGEGGGGEDTSSGVGGTSEGLGCKISLVAAGSPM